MHRIKKGCWLIYASSKSSIHRILPEEDPLKIIGITPIESVFFKNVSENQSIFASSLEGMNSQKVSTYCPLPTQWLTSNNHAQI